MEPPEAMETALDNAAEVARNMYVLVRHMASTTSATSCNVQIGLWGVS